MKRILSIILLSFCPLFAQSEILTNADVIEMTKAGLSQKVILEKIKSSVCEFDASAKALIELKNAGADDEVIAEVIGKSKRQRVRIAPTAATSDKSANYSENTPNQEFRTNQTPLEILRNARTIAIKKSSLHPSRQNLEKALLRRDEWRKFNLTLTEFPENADLYIDIAYVSLSWISHRYVFRIFETRSGMIIAAGETTSWGSLPDNLAKNIIKSLNKLN
jgi:hypothetical protein